MCTSKLAVWICCSSYGLYAWCFSKKVSALSAWRVWKALRKTYSNKLLWFCSDQMRASETSWSKLTARSRFFAVTSSTWHSSSSSALPDAYWKASAEYFGLFLNNFILYDLLSRPPMKHSSQTSTLSGNWSLAAAVQTARAAAAVCVAASDWLSTSRE